MLDYIFNFSLGKVALHKLSEIGKIYISDFNSKNLVSQQTKMRFYNLRKPCSVWSKAIKLFSAIQSLNCKETVTFEVISVSKNDLHMIEFYINSKFWFFFLIKSYKIVG